MDFFGVIQNERVDTFWKYLAEFLCEKKIIASFGVNSKGKHPTVKCVFPFLQGLSKKKTLHLFETMQTINILNIEIQM